MNLQGIFKSSPSFVQLAVLIGLSIFGGTLGFTIFSLSAAMMEISTTNIDMLRLMQFWVSICSFLLAAYWASYLFSDDTNSYLQTNSSPTISTIILTVIAIIASAPCLNYLVYLNEQVQFPESMKGIETILRDMETAARTLTEQMLKTDKYSLLIFNIILFGVVAGVGEEFFFRGVLQRIVGKAVRNPHVVIWIVAFIFSAVHFQFYGFIPRMMLGAMMGYLLMWTNCIWVPVIAHFAHNSSSVFFYYFASDTDYIEQVNILGTGGTWWLSLLSLFIVLCVLFAIKKINQTTANRQKI